MSTTEVTVTVENITYKATVDGEGGLALYADGVFAGRGWYRNGFIECDAGLSDEVYDALQAALRAL